MLFIPYFYSLFMNTIKISLPHIPCLKEDLPNLSKYLVRELQKVPISQLFSELEKI